LNSISAIPHGVERFLIADDVLGLAIFHLEEPNQATTPRFGKIESLVKELPVDEVFVRLGEEVFVLK
jgi:hypothetical protein